MEQFLSFNNSRTEERPFVAVTNTAVVAKPRATVHTGFDSYELSLMEPTQNLMESFQRKASDIVAAAAATATTTAATASACQRRDRPKKKKRVSRAEEDTSEEDSEEQEDDDDDERSREKSCRAKMTSSSSAEREKFQRAQRDTFRRRVLKLADGWISLCRGSAAAAAAAGPNGRAIRTDTKRKCRCASVSNVDTAAATCPCDLKHRIVVNEDKRRRPRKRPTTESDVDEQQRRSDDLFNQQNGYFYYRILVTDDLKRLVSSGNNRRVPQSEQRRIDDYVDRLAIIADIYLRVMFYKDIRPAVFIKFDDNGVPVLFARQTKRSPDTCMSGPPGRYWTKVLHLDSAAKTSQHVALGRVRSSRLTQDSTFVVVGDGDLEQMYTVVPERFTSSSRHRRCFKEIFKFVNSLPEIDVSMLGWEIVCDAGGVLDPLKTHMPRVNGPDERPADDDAFANYTDMLVTMIAHRLKMEEQVTAAAAAAAPRQHSPKLTVHRTEYKFEVAGRSDFPGLFYFRNGDDFVTELSVASAVGGLFGAQEMLNKARVDDGDGIYFYDVHLVDEVVLKLRSRGVCLSPSHSEFGKYVLADSDDVKEMIAYSKHTIDRRVDDVLADDTFSVLCRTDPARWNPADCLERHVRKVSVKTRFGEYKSTFYFEKGKALTRLLGNSLPQNLERRDCVLRAFRLKWLGPDGCDGKDEYAMYPVFAAVFKDLSLYREVVPERGAHRPPPDEEFVFPEAAAAPTDDPLWIPSPKELYEQQQQQQQEEEKVNPVDRYCRFAFCDVAREHQERSVETSHSHGQFTAVFPVARPQQERSFGRDDLLYGRFLTDPRQQDCGDHDHDDNDVIGHLMSDPVTPQRRSAEYDGPGGVVVAVGKTATVTSRSDTAESPGAGGLANGRVRPRAARELFPEENSLIDCGFSIPEFVPAEEKITTAFHEKSSVSLARSEDEYGPGPLGPRAVAVPTTRRSYTPPRSPTVTR